MRHTRYIFLLGLLPMINSITVHVQDSEEDLRVKRQINALPLVYPYGATYKLLLGFALPVPKDKNLVFAINFQYQYIQFQNISQLSKYYFIKEVAREQRDADLVARKNERLAFYRSMADILNSKGMNGFECVLRAICEAAQYPVLEEGLVGELIHILLTPDYGRTPFDEEDLDEKENMAVYQDAAVAGRQMFNCAAIYSGCPEEQGLMELISYLSDE
ncbi:uncharacterized protein [Epargyreus clarus]|uniref:uncharacterized protein n=1 Tax=Epargyreus clarus TaxID=520877 RepID=UPI003C2B3E21